MDILWSDNEQSRLEALHSLQILGSESQPEFDAVVETIADLFDCPISLVSLVAESDQWFKARCGLDAEGTPRNVSFCQHAILNDDLLIVSDALEDERFRDNPLVQGDPHIRFYAGCPLSIDGQHKLGTLCVIDREPRTPSAAQLKQLRRMGTIVEGLIRAHKTNLEKDAAVARAAEEHADAVLKHELLQEIANTSGVGGWELCLHTNNLTWTDKTREIHEVADDFVPTVESAISFYPTEHRDTIIEAVQKGIVDGERWDLELPFVTDKGTRIWVRAVGDPVIEDGKTVRIIGAFQDITERKRIEAELEENERLARLRTEELEAILAHMRQGVSVFNQEGKLTLWNKQYIEIFNKPVSEIKHGASLIDLITAEKLRGEFEGNVQEHVLDLTIRLSCGEVVRSKFKHPSGKIIQAVHTPLPGGGWIGTHEDITASEQAVKKIQHAAHHDVLTGLANRTLFNLRLDQALKSATSNDAFGDVMLLDLDRFKPVNDTYGHDAGDELLKQVARRLEQSIRSSDLVARLGGDEFGVILRHVESANAHAIAKRIVESLSEPFEIFGNEIAIGVSAGIAPIASDLQDARKLIKNADLALYAVKNSGRNAYRFFDESLERTLQH